MITRSIESRVLKISAKIPIVTIIGPRQAGKTTLARSVFPDHDYVNLESLRNREFAAEDPVGFLRQFSGGVVIDEIQRVPDLLSEIQAISDASEVPGRFVLTGSQNILLMESISQTLAGRTIIFKLLPFSLEELKLAGLLQEDYSSMIYKGFYPRLYDRNLSPEEWMPSYIETYAERDVRTVKNIIDLPRFQKFLALCAGRIGQVLNYASLTGDVGVDEKTIKSWIGILETTFVAFRLMPYHSNFGKRVIKTPKLYFYDTGLACYLLGVRSPGDVRSHYLRGGLFENLVIVDLIKYSHAHEGERPFYFWRDSNGHEIDVLTERSGAIHAFEIKSAETIKSAMMSGLKFFKTAASDRIASSSLVYAGNQRQKRTSVDVIPWFDLAGASHPWINV